MLTALLLCLAPQEPAAPRLLLEDLEGRRSELAASALPLADPRTKGAWIVRPEGYERAGGAEDGAAESRAAVTLVDGDELRARVLGGAGESLVLELVEGVRVPFELSALRSLVFPARIPADQRLALAPAPEGDRLYRRTAALDALDGTLEGFADEGVRFDSVLGQRTIPWGEVGALFIESLDAAPKGARGSGVPVSVAFAGSDGGRVRGALVALERDGCRLVLGGASEVKLPWHAVAEVVVADGRLSYLSELAPTSESGRGAPFGDELGMSWPHRMDRNVLGGELRAGGAAHRRGIGMHAPSQLVFALDGGFRSLRGAVAIDDSVLRNASTARGSVLFRVRADGELLWESAPVRGGDPVLPMPALALAGKHELVLEVDPAGDFAGDRADWLGLVLVRE
jgi:NPCBM/NEW2 domain-containing protein